MDQVATIQPAGSGGVQSDATERVPYHTHNGIDSPFIADQNPGSTSGVTSVAITSFNEIASGIADPTGAVDITLTLTLQDITINNVNNARHGFAPKSPNDATKYLNGASVPDYETVQDAHLGMNDVITNNANTFTHGFLPKLSGNANDVLKGTGEFGTPTVTVHRTHGQTMLRLGNAGSGIQTVPHNLTVPATEIEVFAFYDSPNGFVQSEGASTGNGQDDCVFNRIVAGSAVSSTSNGANACIFLEWGSGSQTSQIASATFDATNIYFLWTLSGSNTNSSPICLFWKAKG